MTKGFSQRGSITLVALCFVAVMAIGLASYLAVSNQSMKLANRSYAKDVSKSLAEKGLEMALLGLKTNDWSSSGTGTTWTLSGTTATATVNVPNNSYGTSGFTATVKVRVDNYGAYNQAATWNGTTNYKLNDVVGADTNSDSLSDMWFRCMATNTNTAPSTTGNLAYWAPAPVSWTWSTNITYALYDIVNYNGVWYRCISGHTGQTPLNPATGAANTKWVTIPKDVTTWSSSTAYPAQAVVNYNSVNYRCILAHTNHTPPNATYWSTNTVNGISLSWAANTYYTRGAIVYNSSDGLWYYCDNNHDTTGVASFAADLAANANNWKATTAAADYTGHLSWRWVSSNANMFKYNDVIYYYGNWYRYISTATTSSSTVPSSSSRWEDALSDSWSWASGNNYSIGDVVYRNSSFYRCIVAHDSTGNTGRPPNTAYWSADPLQSPDWDSGKNYSQYDTVRYHGSWYLSLTSSNSGQTPTDTSSTYWAVAPRVIATWDSAKNYNIDDLVSYSGTWYRCIKNTTAYEVPSNTTYWSPQTGATGSYAPWSSSTGYSAGNYVSYGGAWYKCILAPTANQSPNDSTYWSASWVQSSGVTTGAPVIYAEGAVTMPDTAVIKTQLRATASPAPLFPNAVASTGTVTISGGGTVDSYDASTDSTPSSPTNLGYSAPIASSYSSGTAISISSTTVKGYLAAPSATTSPYAPRYSTGGTLLANSSVATGIDLNRISRSPYIPDFDILVPIQHTTMPNSTISIGTPGAPTPSVYYYSGNLSLSGTLTINGPVIIYINGYLRLNTGSIVINSTGSAVIHFTYLRVYSGSAGFINRTYDPKKLALFGRISGTTTNYLIAPSPAATFYGVIYLPDTTATLGLDIRTGNTIQGALSAKEITFSSEANLHYDTSLRYATFPGIDTPFQLDRWRELTDTTERAVLP